MRKVRMQNVRNGIPIVWCPACEKKHGHREKRNRMVPGHGSWSGKPLFRCPNDAHHAVVYEEELDA
jgi:hypothetical protein